MSQTLSTETDELIVARRRPGSLSVTRVGTLARTARSDPMARGSFVLIANTAFGAVLGFCYWIAAGHLFTAAELGPVSAALSLTGLATMAASLGMPATLIRYLPQSDNQWGMMRRALLLCCTVALVGTSVAWVVADRAGAFGGRLPLTAALVAAVLVAAAAAGNVLDAVALALGRPTLLLAETGASGLVRFVAIIAVSAVGAGELGLLSTAAIGTAAGSATLVVCARRTLRLRAGPTPMRLREHRTYAGANLVSGLVSIVPAAIAPAVAVSANGAEAGAYVALPLLLLGMINIGPSMTCRSLFVEASRTPERLRVLALRALAGSWAMSVPLAATTAIFAPFVMRVFGGGYAGHSVGILRWMCVAGVLGTPNYVADAVFGVRADRRGLVLATVLGTLAVVGALLISSRSGVTAIGLGWAVGQLSYGVCSWTLIAARGHLSRERST